MDDLRRSLGPALDIDGRLADIERGLNLLLNVTPVNSAEAWADFERSGFTTEPTLRLRELDFDPDLVRRDLYDLGVEEVDDPALEALFRTKRDEIGRQITTLEDRDTSRFLYGSLQLYGDVSDTLLADAEALLAEIPRQAPSSNTVTAGSFAERAGQELERYRASYPGFPVRLEVRNDVSELMVSYGRLLIPGTAAIRADRVEALIHHEIGTHVVTYQNGTKQPLKLLTTGLPGYDETQEGLAVLAEYVTGGLDPNRLRVLAARVVAVSELLKGAGFKELFDMLHEEHDFHPRTAWSVSTRVMVGGGSTKDIVYLRGITRMLAYLAEGRDLDIVLIGKLSLDHVPLLQELLERGILQPAWVRPHWLEAPGAGELLARARSGITVTELLEGSRPR